jgi:hypothetical protein
MDEILEKEEFLSLGAEWCRGVSEMRIELL